MSGMLRKGMSWLGLGSDEEYDEYEDYDDYADDDGSLVDVTAARSAATPNPVRSVPAPSRDEPADSWDDADAGSGVSSSASVRVLPTAIGSRRGSVAVAPEPVRPRTMVRPVQSSSSTRPHVVSPKYFNDAQEVGDWFRKRQPVIVNLQELDRDLARRLLDFSSGVAYGLGGTVERVASHVYLLTPADVEISGDERRRLRESGLAEG